MDERGFAGFEFMGVVHQIVCGEPMNHGGGRLLIADSGWDWHEMFFRRRYIFRIRSQGPAPCDAVAHFYDFGLRTDRRDHAGAFLPGNEWEWRTQTTIAELHVNCVHACNLHFDDRLGALCLRNWYVHQLQ